MNFVFAVLWICICVFACLWLCICVFAFLWICICVFAFLWICICVFAFLATKVKLVTGVQSLHPRLGALRQLLLCHNIVNRKSVWVILSLLQNTYTSLQENTLNSHSTHLFWKLKRIYERAGQSKLQENTIHYYSYTAQLLLVVNGLYYIKCIVFTAA